jgi:hypothetical protein
MATQTYKTHRHNPKLTTVGFLFLVLSVVGFILSDLGIGGRYTVALGVAGLIASVAILLSISRIYITRLQDRIIKLEMRVRALSVLTPAQRETLARLKKAQLVALRFASDEELGALAERAEREQLSADQIKQAIKNWVPDFDRT